VIVTFLSDFGTRDTFVGQMKGALLAVCPGARPVDLTHHVPPQDVRNGAFQLWWACEPFPAGTIHVAVIDPGVGTGRRALALRSKRGDVLIGPDNGLLTIALDRLGGLAAGVALSDPAYWRSPTPSSTFHGRDVFAPAAGHICSGVPLEKLGPAVTDPERPFTLTPPKRDGEDLVGEIVHVDVYGNLVTSFTSESLPPRFRLWIGGIEVKDCPHVTYRSVPVGRFLAVVGSSGLLEIAVRDGSAAKQASAKVGDPVIVFAGTSEKTRVEQTIERTRVSKKKADR
jgi:S-adenosylmethionine hydrolase